MRETEARVPTKTQLKSAKDAELTELAARIARKLEGWRAGGKEAGQGGVEQPVKSNRCGVLRPLHEHLL